MKLDRRLNLVLSVTREDGTEVWVHHTPIRREVYTQHFLVLTKTISSMYEQSLPPGMCARIGLMMLRKTADDMGVRDAVEGGLLPELWRMTNVLVPGSGTNGTNPGWTTLPFEKVVAEKTIDEEDAEEVKNHIAFFTAASWIHKKSELDSLIYPMLKSLGSQIVSLNSTEFASSLQTSTPAASIGATVTASSIPS